MIDIDSVWHQLIQQPGSIYSETRPGPLRDLLHEYVRAAPTFLAPLLAQKVDFTTFLRSRVLITRHQLAAGVGERACRLLLAEDGQDIGADEEEFIRNERELLVQTVSVAERLHAAVLARCVDEISDPLAIAFLETVSGEYDAIDGEARHRLDAGTLTFEDLLTLQPLVLLAPNQNATFEE